MAYRLAKQDEEIEKANATSHIYKIKSSSKQIIKEINYNNFRTFTNSLYSLIQYQLAYQSYRGNPEKGLGNEISQV